MSDKRLSLTGGFILVVSDENFEARVTPTFTKHLLKGSALTFGQVPPGTSVFKVFQSCFGPFSILILNC